MKHCCETNNVVRKSKQLGLSFPYDWSNPSIRDGALILNVLERGIYEDICKICVYYGISKVEEMHLQLTYKDDPSLIRMLDNISKGFARAQAQ